MRRVACSTRACALLVLLLVSPLAEAQLSLPIAHESNVKGRAFNKFLRRKAEHDDRRIEKEE